MMEQITLLVIFLTLTLSMFENKSNFPTVLVIPAITLALTKFLLGDLDTGYQWTSSDAFYVIYILLLSFFTLTLIAGSGKEP